MTTIRVFADGNCTTQITSAYINSMQTTALKTSESNDELNHAQIIFDEQAETTEASDTL